MYDEVTAVGVIDAVYRDRNKKLFVNGNMKLKPDY